MALNFPSSPSVGDVYQRWTWNGTGWAPTVTAAQPMLPIAGGNITGNLGVAGTTTLTGTLSALGQSQINTLNVAGQATFADGTETDALDVTADATVGGELTVGTDLTVQGDAAVTGALTVAGDPVATEDYVDNRVTGATIYQGTWQVAANTPDLTAITPQQGWYWLAVTADPLVAETAPAGILGIAGEAINNGDMIIWHTGGFQKVGGGGLTKDEADARFLQLSGGNMAGAITMPGDPSGAYDVATKNYVDNKAIIPQAPSNFPYVTSLPNYTYSGGQYYYALTIPGWTFASTDLIIIRNSWAYAFGFQLNINGLGPRPVMLANYLLSGGLWGMNSRTPAGNLGNMNAGYTGQGTHGLSDALPGWSGNPTGGGFDWPRQVTVNYIILQYTGGAGGYFRQVTDNWLAAALTRVATSTLISGVGHQWQGAARSLGNTTAQEIVIWQHQPYTILNLSGAAGQREIYFRTRDISTYSIHNRNIRGQIRRLQGINYGAAALTLRISPRSDAWSGMLEAGCGPYNFTSSYTLQAPMRLYNSGVITSAPGAGYIDAPIPAGAQIEIKFKTMEPTGLASTRAHITTFSASSFPNARTVVFIEDINVYVTA